jgi:hypothetical protein
MEVDLDVLRNTDAQDLADYKQAAEVLRDEVKRLRVDVWILLEQIDQMLELGGDDLEADDRAVREQIKADYAP